jgi:hypothetical protein
MVPNLVSEGTRRSQKPTRGSIPSQGTYLPLQHSAQADSKAHPFSNAADTWDAFPSDKRHGP